MSAARRAWAVYETWHAVVYFAPESTEAFKAIGLKGWWMGYFASRSACMGPVPAGVVQATFYNFHPDMVARAIPDAWSLADPQTVLDARLQAMDGALRRLVPEAVDDPALAAVVADAKEAALAAPAAGRPLYGALRALPWPDQPHLALWHAATLLREHRGDGHNAVLVANGIGGCQAHVLQVAAGRDRQRFQDARRWSDDDWAAATAGLAARGLLDGDGHFTSAGQALYDDIERLTDEHSEAPWLAIGPERTDALIAAWLPWARKIAERGGVPQPNPVGVPAL